LRVRNAFAIFAVLVGSSAAYAAPKLPCGSIAEYRAALVHVSDALKQDKPNFDSATESLPASCEFTQAGQHFSINLVNLEARIISAGKDKDDEQVEEVNDIRHELDRLISGIDRYSQPADPTVEPKLQSILSRSEFRRVNHQNAGDALHEWMMQLMFKLLSLMMKNPEEVRWVAEALTWTVGAAVVLFLLWWIYRWVSRKGPDVPRREYVPFSPSAKHWRDWLSEAHASMAEGDFRESIHRAYWAAISHLESRGAWRPDRARTPREYLRIMLPADPARSVLTDLTREFEVVWYGNRVPGAAQCDAFITKVEQVACKN
jgi:hypothetical protein